MDDRILRFIEENPSHHLYSYQRLDTDNSFRLVEILPGIGDENIAVKISNYRLDSAPLYSALSYTWGEETGIVYISCNGFDLPVTETLADVIRVFRQADIRGFSGSTSAVLISQISRKGLNKSV
jgi:hypothetical protein